MLLLSYISFNSFHFRGKVLCPLGFKLCFRSDVLVRLCHKAMYTIFSDSDRKVTILDNQNMA